MAKRKRHQVVAMAWPQNIKERGLKGDMAGTDKRPDGRIVAVSRSNRKGVKKTNVDHATLVEDFGFEHDAHAGKWHRQISLLAAESIKEIRQKGIDVAPGDFAENITTKGMALWQLPVGTRMELGDEALVEVTQIGKKCHNRCAIYHQVGDCVMPRKGIFARVLRGGRVKPGDRIRVLCNKT